MKYLIIPYVTANYKNDEPFGVLLLTREDTKDLCLVNYGENEKLKWDGVIECGVYTKTEGKNMFFYFTCYEKKLRELKKVSIANHLLVNALEHRGCKW